MREITSNKLVQVHKYGRYVCIIDNIDSKLYNRSHTLDLCNNASGNRWVLLGSLKLSSSGSITCKLYMFSKTLKVELMTWNVDQNIEQREVKKLKK